MIADASDDRVRPITIMMRGWSQYIFNRLQHMFQVFVGQDHFHVNDDDDDKEDTQWKWITVGFKRKEDRSKNPSGHPAVSTFPAESCHIFRSNIIILSDPISSYCPIQYRHIVRSNIVIFSDPILSYCPIQYRLVILSNLISSYCRIQYPFPSHRLARHNKSGLLLLSLYRHNHHCRMIIPTLYQDLI